jgi:radical SAM protein with 4Fe4S-binding SPASM domain
MQGLRLLITGGEPLLHPDFSLLGKSLSRARVRKVLLTNGTTIGIENTTDWNWCDEIQFSLDGLQQGHEALRGTGTFARTVQGIEIAKKNGMDVSIATMVHRQNLSELKELASFVESLGALEWNLDVPCISGRLDENADFLVTPEEGAPFLKLSWGGSYHGSDEPFACGYHLCTVTPGGDVLKCGFYPDKRLGTIEEGLETCWKRLHHIPLSDLACNPCSHLLECKGGCRFRAPDPKGKDPVMCALYNAP